MRCQRLLHRCDPLSSFAFEKPIFPQFYFVVYTRKLSKPSLSRPPHVTVPARISPGRLPKFALATRKIDL